MIDIFNYKTQGADKILRRLHTLPQVKETVSEILENVKQKGDEALFAYCEKFGAPKMSAQTLCVKKEAFDMAYKATDEAFIKSIRKAKENILDYHISQMKKEVYIETAGTKIGSLFRAVERAGIYVPGGKASYPSSVLMCVLPALAAGVNDIVIATPNIENPLVLVAARECGVSKVYQMGGAQAIAALAYGTESVEKVNVIAGPGNVFVTEAKRQVFGEVNIDMPAGPSEILVIADESANPAFLAADLLSQAEHDEMAMSVLITLSDTIARQTAIELEKQASILTKKAIIDKSISQNSAIIVVETLEEAFELSNKIAPEHLELCIENADEHLSKVQNAGAIFVGNYSPEPLGDYMAGPSHCLPTDGAAKAFSVLSTDIFLKRVSYIKYDKSALSLVKDDIVRLAESEGFTAHSNAVKVRFQK